MASVCRALLLVALGLLYAGPGAADEARPAAPVAPEQRVLSVATREVPPFAMRDAKGAWQGLSVDLWKVVAERIGVSFEWRELELADTLTALERGEVDAGVVALTVTQERERRFDFAYPYLASGLSLAIDAERRFGWLAAAGAFFSLDFLTAVGALIVVLAVAAFGVWVFERRANPAQFGGSTLRGLGEGFWWSAVTMTTVGYGDRAPVTLGGRIVALVWMFTSVIVIASFTASIAASVTVGRLEAGLLDERRLAKLRLAVLEDSRAASYARSKGLRMRAFPDLDAAADALADASVDAVLHDDPVLRHLARERVEGGLEVVPDLLVRDDYAFGLPPGSPLRERVNVALLSLLHEPVWREIRERYLGASD